MPQPGELGVMARVVLPPPVAPVPDYDVRPALASSELPIKPCGLMWLMRLMRLATATEQTTTGWQCLSTAHFLANEEKVRH